MSIKAKSPMRALAAIVSGAIVTALAVVAVPGVLAANADAVSQTFAYTGSTEQFVVPDGITELKVSLLGAEGGEGGWDNTGPIDGGYQGAVTGLLAVTPGEVLTIAVGSAGGDGGSRAGSAVGGYSGSNPIPGYDGGTGGVAGPEGSSGGGAGGGAATIVQTDDQTIIAGGGGGGGGSGQFQPTAGRPGASSFSASETPDSGIGEDGISTATVCVDGIRCDGGASGAGGGGAIGGGPGQVSYGAGDSDEYYGYGGSPGANDASGLSSGSAVYQYYPNDGIDGSVTITYDTSAPAAPTGVSGTAKDGSADVTWLAPLSTGGAPITDYSIQYAVASDSPSWQDFSDGTSSATSATVTGLTNDTAYEFRVAAINRFGSSDYSDPSDSVTPSTAPRAPTLTSVTASDSTLTAAFDTVTSTSPVTQYQYRLDNGGWVDGGLTSPITISSLTNGTTYSVTVRAVNDIGAGNASNARSGTPLATPSAPTITGVGTSIGSATVSFSPGYAGGSPATDYLYRLDSGPWTSISSTTSPFSISLLANATTYSLTLRAHSAVGDGAVSAPSVFTTPGAPAAPTITGVTAGDGTLSVSFATGNNGGLALSGLEYQLVANGAWTSASAGSSPILLTGLANGTAYQVSLRSDNAIGAGAASAPVAATPITVPGAPVLLAGSVVGSNQELDASFSAPASNGGAAITTYEYSTDGGVTWRARATGTTASPLVITLLSSDGTTQLVNGTTYSVEVRAVNSAGSGTSSGVAVGIARTVPTAPSITTVSSRPGALQVQFAGASNGGSPITSYQYRVGSGAWTSTGTLGQTFTIPSLSNGTSYAVQMRAVNSVGTSDPSIAVSGTPASQPGQASIASITPLDSALYVGASLASDGGSSLTSWQYTTDGGATWATAPGGSPFTITTQSSNSAPLVNGVSYSVALRAINALGAGAASATAIGIPMTTPSAPTITVTPQNGSLLVGYTAGATGGSSINGAQYNVGSGWISAGSLQSSFVVAPLTNGTAYSVQVRLTNAAGAGAVSVATPGTPRTVPDAPASVTATSDDSAAVVAWQAPATGGSPITGYTATAWSSSAGGAVVSTCTATTLTCGVAGLSNGTVYYVSVNATNAAGTGAASAPRVAVLPLAKPAAPTINDIQAANTFLSVDFTAGDPGSSPISGYQYSLDGITWVSTPVSSSPLVISGLTNGTNYSVQLRAVNQSGAGAVSNTVDGTPYSEPDVPDASTISIAPQWYGGDVSWAAPNDNGSPITGYDVVAWSSQIQGYQVDSCSTDGATSCSLWDLYADGETYYVTVDATNAAGTTARSTPRVAFTPGAPDAVTDLQGVAGDGDVSLSWTPGDEDQDSIYGYDVLWAPAGSSDYTDWGVTWDVSADVAGLTNGDAYTFEVIPLNGYGDGQPAYSDQYTPMAAGVTPTFGTPLPTVDGFTANILSPDPDTNYTATVDATNGSVEIVNGTITVTGLNPGQDAVVTVTATKFGSVTQQGIVEASALQTGVAPVLGTATRTADGFTVPLLSSAPLATLTPTVTYGSVSLIGDDYVVADLDPSEQATLTVSSELDGYTPTDSERTSSALDLGIAPLLSDPTSTANGFTVTILNPDLLGSYSVTVDSGSAVVSGNLVTVIGLNPGDPATVDVTTMHAGRAPADTPILGSALLAGADLTRSDVTLAAAGFSFWLTNFDSTFDYSVTTSAGHVTFVDGVVTVTGLEPGQVATVSLSAIKAGHAGTEAGTDSGPQIAQGTTPVLSTSTATANGFTMTIENYSIDAAYTVAVDAGTVTQTGALLTVTGLSAAQSATVSVSAARDGYTTESATATGSALAATVLTAAPSAANASAANASAVTAVNELALPGVAPEGTPNKPSAVLPIIGSTRAASNSTTSAPDNWLWLIVVAVVLLVLIAILAWRRRRGVLG